MKEKIIQVCKESECDNKPLMDVEIGSKKHNFCCEKGFEKALSDFDEYLKNPRE